MQPPPLTTPGALLERYDALLFDAYGVLVSSSGALPGARDLITRLLAEDRDFLVVSNDASREPSTCASFYASVGLPIPAERVVTSGGLLPRVFEERGLVGAPTCVLGPEGSLALARAAGADLVPPSAAFDVLVVADEAGFPFLETVDEVISRLFAAFAAGREPLLLLPNPDELYPKGDGAFGLAAGSIALLVEAALARRFPEQRPRFVRLGKPAAPIFEEARRRLPGRRLVMLGDQVETDVRGARDAGIDSVLVETGLDRFSAASAVAPTFRLASLVAGEADPPG